MDHDRNRPPEPASTTPRALLHLLLGAALVAVAVLTLTPEGNGWTWGSPTAELRWYATGLDSEATVLQLVGNLGLVAVPAALVVALWPGAGRFDRLTRLGIAAGTGIELLQWALPLGRVVSPLDAALNALGAVAAGLLVRHVQHMRAGSGSASGAPPVSSGLTVAAHGGHNRLRHN